MIDPRSACLVGVAQETIRAGDGPAPEPIEGWVRVATAAARDARGPDLLRHIDSLQVVFCQSWAYDDPTARLADRLGAAPRHRAYSGVGGTTPQQLLTETAQAMARGELDSALIVGGEALATRRQIRRSGDRPAWSHPHPDGFRYPPHSYPHPTQQLHGATMPTLTFPLFDSARRASRGTPPDRYLADIGAMLAPMTDVASKNPHAWFPVPASADELVTTTRDNRLVGSPYPKRTIAVMDVDMAAAVIVMTHAAADRHAVPRDRRVYLHSSAFAEDPDTVAERDDMSTSPAMATSSAAALRAAGLSVDDIAHLDLYSCFASALHLACDALRITPTDSRGLTVTGGLPYAGGPGSNYVLHSLASMVEVLREDAGSFGLVSGLSLHLTGHSYAVYSTAPGPATRRAPCATDSPRRPIVATYDGPATVAAYTVSHDRAGDPDFGVVVYDGPDEARGYARVDDPALLVDAMQRELVGQRIEVTTDGSVNTATW